MYRILFDTLCRALALCSMVISPSMLFADVSGTPVGGSSSSEQEGTLFLYESSDDETLLELTVFEDQSGQVASNGVTIATYSAADLQAYSLELLDSGHDFVTLELYEDDVPTGDTLTFEVISATELQLTVFDAAGDVLSDGLIRSHVPFRSLVNNNGRQANAITCWIIAVAAVATLALSIYNTVSRSANLCQLSAFLQCSGASDLTSNRPCGNGAVTCCSNERTILQNNCIAAGGQPGSWSCVCN